MKVGQKIWVTETDGNYDKYTENSQIKVEAGY